MAFEVQMECTQTEVKEQGEIGYRSGERLPVGHKDVDATWVPVVVEVDDSPSAPSPSVQTSVATKTTSTAAPAAKTGVKSND